MKWLLLFIILLSLNLVSAQDVNVSVEVTPAPPPTFATVYPLGALLLGVLLPLPIYLFLREYFEGVDITTPKSFLSTIIGFIAFIIGVVGVSLAIWFLIQPIG